VTLKNFHDAGFVVQLAASDLNSTAVFDFVANTLW